MDPFTLVSSLASVVQLGDYAARAHRAFDRRDRGMVAWKSLVDAAAQAAIQAHAGHLSPDRQGDVFHKLHELVAANDERAWAVLGGARAVGDTDLGDLDPKVVGLVESFAREITSRLAAEASRAGSPLANLTVVASLGTIGVGVTRIGETIDAIAEGMRSLVAAQPADLSETPVSVRRALDEAREVDGEGAGRLERLITGGEGAAAALAALVAPDAPAWWQRVAGLTMVAAGEHAAAYGADAIASQLFESAADLEGTNRARCLARAALEARDDDALRAAALAEKATQLEDGDLLVGAVDAVLKDDSAAALELLGASPHELDPDMLILAGVQRWALANADRVTDAVSLARRTVEIRPDAAGMYLQLASLLLARAEASRSSREADLDEAMSCALEARRLRRSWHGDSAEAVLVACEVAHQLEDMATILRLGHEPPHGEAVRTEAIDDRVIAAVAVAAAIEGDQALADRLLPEVTSVFHRHLLLGWKAARGGDNDIAALELRQAAAEADNDSHLIWALRTLATLGEWPLPGFDEFARRDPESAEVLRGMSELHRGHLDDAIRRLNPLRRNSALIPIVLAEAHERAGRADAAVEELRAGFENHGDPGLLALACRILLRAERFDDAERIADDAISVVPSSRPHRREFRQLLIELASRRGDHRRVEDLAAAGIAEGDDDLTLRWHLARVLHLRNAHDEAWDIVRRDPPLEPRNEREAELWLQVHAHADTRRTTVTQMLEVVRRFPDSEQVHGTALVLFYTRRGDRGVEDDEGEAIKALAEAFVQRWPESEIMWARSVTPDDDELFAEQITEIARLSAGRQKSMLDVGEMYDAGRAPYGLLARVARSTIVEGLVSSLRPLTVAAPSATAERNAEREAAANAIDQTVSVDLLAVHVAAINPDLWATIQANFRRFVVADPAIADVEAAIAALSLNRGGSLGWDDVTGRPVVTGPTRELDAQHREAAQHLRGRLAPLDTSPCTTLRSFPDFDAGAAAWLGPLQIAIDAPVPFYSDDLALRRLARSFGVAAFGTVAVIEALADTGRLGQIERATWLSELHDARIVDVYVDAEDVTAGGHDANAAAVCLSRPWVWSSAEAVRRVLSFVIACRDPEALAVAGYWYGVGASRMRDRDEAADRCARFIGDLLSDIQTTAAAPRAIALVRRACIDRGVDDPLPAAVRNLHRDLSRAVGRDEGARLTLQLFSGLDTAEQQVVLRTLSFG